MEKNFKMLTTDFWKIPISDLNTRSLRTVTPVERCGSHLRFVTTLQSNFFFIFFPFSTFFCAHERRSGRDLVTERSGEISFPVDIERRIYKSKRGKRSRAPKFTGAFSYQTARYFGFINARWYLWARCLHRDRQRDIAYLHVTLCGTIRGWFDRYFPTYLVRLIWR